DQVGRLHLLEEFDVSVLPRRENARVLPAEAHGLLSRTLLDDLFQAYESPSANEENVGGVNRRAFLVGMLASALWGHVGDGPFQNLQEGLLYTLAGDIASDRDILILFRDLVDFVNI